MAPQVGVASDEFRSAMEEKLTTGRYTEVLQTLNDELASARRQNDEVSAAMVLLFQGEAHLFQGNGADGLQAARAARSAFQKLCDKKMEASALLNESHAFSLLEDLQQSKQAAQTAKNLAESTGDSECIARAWHMVSLLDDGAAASKGAQRAIDHYREIGDRASEAMMLCNLSDVLLSEGRIPEALSNAEDAASICRSLGHWANEVCALKCIVAAKHAKMQTQQALETVKDRLAAFERANDQSAHAALLLLVADAQYVCRDNQMAVNAATQAKRIYDGMADRRQSAIAQLKIANLHLEQKQFDDALRFAQESVSLFREVAVSNGVVEANRVVAFIFTAKGEPEKSPYRQQALTHIDELAVAIGKKDAEAYHRAMQELQLTGGMSAQDEERILTPLMLKDEQGVRRFLKEVEDPDTKQAPAVVATQIETQTTYHNFTTGGLQYGPAFRRIQDSWRVGEKNSLDCELYTVLQLHDTAEGWEEALPFLHPGIADGSLQCQVGLQG